MGRCLGNTELTLVVLCCWGLPTTDTAGLLLKEAGSCPAWWWAHAALLPESSTCTVQMQDELLGVPGRGQERAVFWAKLYQRGRVSMGWQNSEPSNGKYRGHLRRTFQAVAAWPHLCSVVWGRQPQPGADGGQGRGGGWSWAAAHSNTTETPMRTCISEASPEAERTQRLRSSHRWAFPTPSCLPWGKGVPTPPPLHKPDGTEAKKPHSNG